jgi:energy-converting hydrogenase Eha subunit A
MDANRIAALVRCSDMRVGYLLCLVHSVVPLVVALPSWRRERNYKDAFSPVAMKASRIPIFQFR